MKELINWLKLWFFIISFIFLNLISIIKILVKKDGNLLYELLKKFCNKFLSKYKIKLNVHGSTPKDNNTYIYVSNHRSMYDPSLLMGLTNKETSFFIAIEFLKYVKLPLLRKAKDLMYNAYIDRSNIRSGVQAIKYAIEQLKDDKCNFMIFPEGKLISESDNELISSFNTGAFKCAIESQKPIIPITILNSEKIHDSIIYYQDIKPGVVDIYINDPISYEEFKDLNSKELAKFTKDIIEKELKGAL